MPVKWNNEGFIFWSTKGTGILRPYKKNELQKLRSEACSRHTVTLKYEGPGKYYILIPVVTKKKESKREKSIALDPGVRTFQTGFLLMATLSSMEKETSRSCLSWERGWTSCNPRWINITRSPI